MDAVPSRTEQVIFNALKLQRKDARAEVGRQAELHHLRIDSIEEHPRRLTVDLHVTVTGDGDEIVSFCKALGGRRSHDPPRGALRRWIDGTVEGLSMNWPW